MTTYVYVLHPETGEPRRPLPEEQGAFDRFLVAFLLKKHAPPAGHWRVPGVGRCLFLPKELKF